jgi:hypothetical protein
MTSHLIGMSIPLRAEKLMNKMDEEPGIGFRAETGELYMLDKKERILAKEVLRLALATPSALRKLEERFGKEGFKIAVNLLEQMGVKVEKPM